VLKQRKECKASYRVEEVFAGGKEHRVTVEWCDAFEVLAVRRHRQQQLQALNKTKAAVQTEMFSGWSGGNDSEESVRRSCANRI
jgi:hypothetical protein